MYKVQKILLLSNKIHTENEPKLKKEVNFAKNFFGKFV